MKKTATKLAKVGVWHEKENLRREVERQARRISDLETVARFYAFAGLSEVTRDA